MSNTKRSDEIAIDPRGWQQWWFTNGGMIHGMWKRRRYTDIKNKVHELAHAAWFAQEDKIDAAQKRIVELNDELDRLRRGPVSKVDVDPHTLQTMLRREYERGAERALETVTSYQDITDENMAEARRDIFNRSTDTQRSAALVSEVGTTVKDDMFVYIIPREIGIRVVVGKPGMKAPAYDTIVQNIFQVQDAISHCRTMLLRSKDGKGGSDSGSIGDTQEPKNP